MKLSCGICVKETTLHLVVGKGWNDHINPCVKFTAKILLDYFIPLQTKADDVGI
jgi:hypothetical protein